MERIPIILDTDIGTNIDDALALWCLLHEPRCELVGVTTVTGQPKLRARIARQLCIAAGKPDVPVIAGAADPVEGPQRQTAVPLAPADTSALPTLADGPSAADFLREQIRRRPGAIMLAAIGPLTNLARLLGDDPHAAANIGGVFAMMGRFGAPADRRDTNYALDPTAARKVLEHARLTLRLVGLDQTLKAAISPEEFSSGSGDVARADLQASLDAWIAERDTITLHDPLTVFVATRASTVAWNYGRLRASASTIDFAIETNGTTQDRRHARLTAFPIFSFQSWFSRRLRGDASP